VSALSGVRGLDVNQNGSGTWSHLNVFFCLFYHSEPLHGITIFQLDCCEVYLGIAMLTSLKTLSWMPFSAISVNVLTVSRGFVVFNNCYGICTNESWNSLHCSSMKAVQEAYVVYLCVLYLCFVHIDCVLMFTPELACAVFVLSRVGICSFPVIEHRWLALVYYALYP
jgi:hypothetical protein